MKVKLVYLSVCVHVQKNYRVTASVHKCLVYMTVCGLVLCVCELYQDARLYIFSITHGDVAYEAHINKLVVSFSIRRMYSGVSEHDNTFVVLSNIAYFGVQRQDKCLFNSFSVCMQMTKVFLYVLI